MRTAWALPVLIFLVWPSTAPADSVAAQRFSVGFHEWPAGLHAGQNFHGGVIVATNEAIGSISVLASRPAEFLVRTHADARTRYVEDAPRIVSALFVPNDPGFVTQYAPKQIGAPFAWDETLGSTSVVVCVVDTGVRHTHEDLVDAYAGGHDFVNNDTDPADDHGHGTHVSGIAAAVTDNAKGISGVARVSLQHMKVLDATGHGTWDVVAQGITACADAGAHIISISLGATTGATVLEDAINYATGLGALVVAAAGNNGPCEDCVNYPAKYPNVVAVSCTTAQKDVCVFSSHGPEIDLVAPGDNIQSTWLSDDASYRFSGGTSMSVPHVSGVAALLKAQNPSWNASALRSKLLEQAEDLGAPGFDNESGLGLLRADRALGASQMYAGRLLVGTAAAPVPCTPEACPFVQGLGYQGLGSVRFGILVADGRAFDLTVASPNGPARASVCWLDADGIAVSSCDFQIEPVTNGTVPASARQAEVLLRLGLDASYTLTINP